MSFKTCPRIVLIFNSKCNYFQFHGRYIENEIEKEIQKKSKERERETEKERVEDHISDHIIV